MLPACGESSHSEFCPLLGLSNHSQSRLLVCSKLLCSERLSTGTASPFSVCYWHAGRARIAPPVFAGTKRHNQLTTASQAQSLRHSDVITTRMSAFSGQN